MTQTASRPRTQPGSIGDSPVRPDAAGKVTGAFAFASDLYLEGMLFGATTRSPHPRARIVGIDVGAALAVPGVVAVLLAEDVPGRPTYGLDRADQPVLAVDQVRYHGEPVALVAADDPATARRATGLVDVRYEVLDPLTDPEEAMTPGAPALHPGGNLLRHVPIRRGDVAAAARAAQAVVVADYEVGIQDQAFLGPEAGLAVPAEDGGVELHVATQWLHVDAEQVAASLGLPAGKVHLTLAGVGGAFGGREDVSMQIHAAMLALRTRRPVRMVYGRQESFVGHVHRHPARMRFEHGADADGRLLYVRARIVLDGGAYASSSTAVVSNAACFAVGPYACENVEVDGYVVYTDNPPAGAMRGFGAVQVAFAHEAQMDALAARLGLDPVEIRVRNALRTGDRMATGQLVRGPAPVADLVTRVAAAPQPQPPPARPDPLELPGGTGAVTRGEGVRRGVGYAVAFKNIGYSEGFDDYSTARVRLTCTGGRLLAEVHTAAAEVGQGLVTVQAQIARTELAGIGVQDVRVLPADTTVGSAGSSSASRQTYMTGGAVRLACLAVRERFEASGGVLAEGAVLEETREFHHRRTVPLDPVTGQGDAHLQLAYAAHRAVVDVDVETGLVRVVELATCQDVGRALNPQAVEGQIEGGSAQGLGLALMEELRVDGGVVRNPSFTDYLIPTVLDMPPVRVEVLELADPEAPYGLRGVGEPPQLSSGPAVLAAVRAATGRPVRHVPLRPDDLVL